MPRFVRSFATVLTLVALLCVPSPSLDALPTKTDRDRLLAQILDWIGWGSGIVLVWSGSEVSTDPPSDPPIEVASPDDEAETTPGTPDSDAELYPEMDPDG